MFDQETTPAERAEAIVARRRSNWAETPFVEYSTRPAERRRKRDAEIAKAKALARDDAEKRNAAHEAALAKIAEAHRAAMKTPEAKAKAAIRANRRTERIAEAQARFSRREKRPGRANKGERVMPHGGR